jgi:hypothetical protein
MWSAPQHGPLAEPGPASFLSEEDAHVSCLPVPVSGFSHPPLRYGFGFRKARTSIYVFDMFDSYRFYWQAALDDAPFALFPEALLKN